MGLTLVIIIVILKKSAEVFIMAGPAGIAWHMPFLICSHTVPLAMVSVAWVGAAVWAAFTPGPSHSAGCCH